MRQAVIYKDEDGMWVAEVPSLPGCVSQGKSKAEAIRNVTEAIELWIESMKSLGEPIPAETDQVEVVAIRAPAA